MPPRVFSRRWRRRTWCAAAAVLVAVAGVVAEAGATGELRIGLPRVPDTVDPLAVTAGPGLVVLRQLFQGLVEVGERGDLVPGLATQWSVSRDGLTWTFRLRADVQFHNGMPLTADAVVASLTRQPPSDEAGRGDGVPPWAQVFYGSHALVREIRRGDAATVQIQLAQPFSPLPAVLAHPALAIALTQSDAPVPFLGTGPFRVVEHAPGRVVLEATGRGDPPRSGRLVFEETAGEPTALADLGPRGRLDAYFPQAPPAPAAIGLPTLSGPTWRLGLLALRTHQGIVARKPVRQAVALGLDPALTSPALGRWGRPWASYLPPGAWAVRQLPTPTYDPARARRLLADARVSSPVLALLAGDVPGGPDVGRLTEAIRLSLAVAGLSVRVRQPAAETYSQALQAGEGELALFEAQLDADDPHFALRPLVASELAGRGSATNVAFYRNPLVDDLLLRGSQFAFPPERLRLYQRLQTKLAEELPYIPLYTRLQWAVTRPGVRDLRLDPAGRHRLDRAWLETPPEPPTPTPALPIGPPDLPAPTPPTSVP